MRAPGDDEAALFLGRGLLLGRGDALGDGLLLYRARQGVQMPCVVLESSWGGLVPSSRRHQAQTTVMAGSYRPPGPGR